MWRFIVLSVAVIAALKEIEQREPITRKLFFYVHFFELRRLSTAGNVLV
jgi:hypothetical protein